MAEETHIQTPTDSPTRLPASAGSPSLDEVHSLERAISSAEMDIRRVEEDLKNMRRKQEARKQELGFQRARLQYKKSSRVQDAPFPGARMVIAVTDCGLSARWVASENSD